MRRPGAARPQRSALSRGECGAPKRRRAPSHGLAFGKEALEDALGPLTLKRVDKTGIHRCVLRVDDHSGQGAKREPRANASAPERIFSGRRRDSFLISRTSVFLRGRCVANMTRLRCFVPNTPDHQPLGQETLIKRHGCCPRPKRPHPNSLLGTTPSASRSTMIPNARAPRGWRPNHFAVIVSGL